MNKYNKYKEKRVSFKYQMSCLDLRANPNSGLPDIRTSGVPYPGVPAHYLPDLHFLGLCHMGRNSISLSGSSPERPLAEILPEFGLLITAWEYGRQVNSDV